MEWVLIIIILLVVFFIHNYGGSVNEIITKCENDNSLRTNLDEQGDKRKFSLIIKIIRIQYNRLQKIINERPNENSDDYFSSLMFDRFRLLDEGDLAISEIPNYFENIRKKHRYSKKKWEELYYYKKFRLICSVMLYIEMIHDLNKFYKYHPDHQYGIFEINNWHVVDDIYLNNAEKIYTTIIDYVFEHDTWELGKK